MNEDVAMPRTIAEQDALADRMRDPVWAEKEIARRVAMPHDVVEEGDDYKIIRTGDMHSKGVIVGYTLDLKKIIYYVVFNTRNLKTVQGDRKLFTQTWVWANAAYMPQMKYPVSRILLDYVLKHVDGLLSDSSQTVHGRRLWERLLAGAYLRKLKVGLWNSHTQEVWKPAPNQSVQEWLDSKSPYNDWPMEKFAWKSPSAGDLRFYIMKN